MFELNDNVLLQLAKALRETQGPTPKCSIEVEESQIIWDTERILFEDSSGVQQTVMLEEVAQDEKEFLYACLQLWLIEGSYHHGSRAEA